MKIIATLLIAITLAFGGLVAPARAADPIPPECEQTVQEWKVRALAAEAESNQWQRAYFDLAMTLRAEQARWSETGARLNAAIDAEKQNVATGNREFMKLFKKNQRLDARVERLREKVRELRHR